MAKKMNSIDKLIDELCPEGVEFRELGDIGDFYSGLSGKGKEDFSNGNEKYVTYMNIYSNIAINTDIDVFVKIGKEEKQNRIEYGDVLFTGSSETPDECGVSSVLITQTPEPLYLNSFCFGFRFNSDNLILPGFSKYLFRDERIRKQIAKTANGVTRFNISKKRFAKIQIPIPPLGIQQEIVNILDTFTTLEAELEAELKARKKQYEYYRDELLTFGDDVEWKTLREVGKWFGGGTPSKSNSEYWRDGIIPWLSPKDMRMPMIEATEDYITESAVTNSATKMVPANSVAIVVRSSILDKALPVAFVPIPITLNQDMKAVVPHAGILPKYIAYVLRSHGQQVLRATKKTGGSVASIEVPKLMSYSIPIPPLAEQERIVAILDNFDALVNDISVGLPAELNARRKQYEYYRNKLLTFKKFPSSGGVAANG